MRLLLLQRCRWCGVDLDQADQAETLRAIRLSGLAPGWRLCRCGQTITGLRRVIIRDRRGVLRHVYRRVYRSPS